MVLSRSLAEIFCSPLTMKKNPTSISAKTTLIIITVIKAMPAWRWRLWGFMCACLRRRRRGEEREPCRSVAVAILQVADHDRRGDRVRVIAARLQRTVRGTGGDDEIDLANLVGLEDGALVDRLAVR